MLFVLALILTLFSAACCNFSTARAEPRLPPLPGWGLAAATLVLAMLLLAARLSTFAAVVCVLTAWMIALPGVGLLRALAKAAKARRTHG
jgi:hypothetical protein